MEGEGSGFFPFLKSKRKWGHFYCLEAGDAGKQSRGLAEECSESLSCKQHDSYQSSKLGFIPVLWWVYPNSRGSAESAPLVNHVAFH